jgi:hypothetical protein
MRTMPRFGQALITAAALLALAWLAIYLTSYGMLLRSERPPLVLKLAWCDFTPGPCSATLPPITLRCT